MKKDIKHAYVIAAIMSLVLYFLGVLTGLFVERSVTKFAEERIEILQRRIENAQLEYVYINALGDKLPCNSLSILVEQTTKEVWDISRELVELENRGEKGEKFYNLKRDYSLLSVRAWILNTYVQERCKKDNIIILYFYSIPCSECVEQGYILDNLRENYFKDKMLVFVLDANIDEPIVQTLKKTYNVNTAPSIVIGNTTYSGLTEKEMLLDIISNITT